MDTHEIVQGGRLVIQPPIVDSAGTPLTGYTGGETLSARIWPGGPRPASYTPVPTWVDNDPPLTQLIIPSAESTALAAGRYQLWCFVTPSASDSLCYYQATLDVIQGPGTEAAPTTYCAYSDLLRYGRSWLRQFQTSEDEAGFAEQLGRARSWIEDLAHAHNRGVFALNAFGGGPLRTGARSVWLQDQLDADKLMVTDQVKEAAAKKALAYICEGQIGTGDAAAYARLARMYHSQADYLGTCLTLGLDTDGDGSADVTIDCSCTDPMYS